MYLRVDIRQVPPAVEVCERDDFTEFKVVLAAAAHAWVEPGVLAELAGRAEDLAWRDKLEAMVSYARSKGWADERGRVRAHVEPATVMDGDPQDGGGR
ncbi:hypothetical protein AB0M32_16420 [Streptomyces sp. NPDC051985]|uniref:hypothetical protein n=1 Tax=Streptomyces sp. NPDC051985 TaxID=3155807 RepID=UPI0034329500